MGTHSTRASSPPAGAAVTEVAHAILVVGDDAVLAPGVLLQLEAQGVAVTTARTLREAAGLDLGGFDLVVVEDALPGGRGIELLVCEEGLRGSGIVVTSHPTLEGAIAAMRAGAVDYCARPLGMDPLVRELRRRPSRRSAGKARRRTARPAPDDLLDPFLPACLREPTSRLIEIASSDRPLLLAGETGTGKSALARILHGLGGRTGPLHVVSGATNDPDALEAELFGVAGARAGHDVAHRGVIEASDGGTLVIDEVDALPATIQRRLLALLDGHEVAHIGGSYPRRVSVRVIATSQRDPGWRTPGGLRPDLAIRLASLQLRLPPLRERLDEITPLAHAFAEQLSPPGAKPATFAAGELARLRAHDWPGNLIELRNVIERSLILSAPGPLLPSRLIEPAGVRRPAGRAAAGGHHPRHATAPEARASMVTGDLSLAGVERAHIAYVVARCGGNRTRAASLLGIGVATLRRKLDAEASSAPEHTLDEPSTRVGAISHR